MEIAQKRNAHRIRYDFNDKALQYHHQDGSGSRSFSVNYMDISRDRETLVERNEWLRNVGLLWVVIGVVLTAINWIGGNVGLPSFWLFIGAGCYGFYRFRATPFTILPSSKGNLLVIDDASGSKVIDEIAARRAAAFRVEYDFFPDGETAEQHRRRFAWLHEEEALTEDQLNERLAQVEAMDASPAAIESTASRPLLN